MSISCTSKEVVSNIGPPPLVLMVPLGDAEPTVEGTGTMLLGVTFGLPIFRSGCLGEGVILIGDVVVGILVFMGIPASLLSSCQVVAIFPTEYHCSSLPVPVS